MQGNMLIEKAKVVDVAQGALWVEPASALQSCTGCSAKQACGKRLFISNKPTARLRIATRDHLLDQYQVGEVVTIGVEQKALVYQVLLAYVFPVLLMIVFSAIAHTVYEQEWLSISAGVSGFVTAALLARYIQSTHVWQVSCTPVLVDT